MSKIIQVWKADNFGKGVLNGSQDFFRITPDPSANGGGGVPYTGATQNVDLGEFGVSAGFVKFDTTPTDTPTDQGTMFWDVDDNTIDVILNGYIMKIGEDQFYPVKNQTGSTITKGTNVKFAGTLGASGRLLIAPFIADGTDPSYVYMGVTAEDILNGEDGKVLWFGRLRGINTNAFDEGDILYASTTSAGGFQTAIPTGSNNVVQVAAVINKSSTQGVIFIRPQIEPLLVKPEFLNLKTQLLDRQTRYFLPRAGSTTFIDNLGVRTIVLSGNSSTNERYQALEFATSATAGTLAFQRGQVFSLPTEETSPFIKLTRRISANSNVADSRFFTGITPIYLTNAPTNVEPDTLLNVIGVGKLSTSDNLHIIHNDASGTATTIDLGSNYPFNNVVFYWYTFEFTKEIGTTNIVVRVTRTDATGDSIFVEHTLTSDLPTVIFAKAPFAWISNNATAEVASYLDYGCIVENYPVKF
jgi:hypothetical protein